MNGPSRREYIKKKLLGYVAVAAVLALSSVSLIAISALESQVAHAQRAGSGKISDGTCRCKTLCVSGAAYGGRYGTSAAGIRQCQVACAAQHAGCNKGRPR